MDEIELQLKIEILSRSIDQLWKTRPFNKNWVTFIDLNDNVNQTRCKADNTGSQALKACGDGGVYYTYSYIEKDSLRGEVDHPYGWDKLKKYDIEPSVRIPSLGPISYRLLIFSVDSRSIGRDVSARKKVDK